MRNKTIAITITILFLVSLVSGAENAPDPATTLVIKEIKNKKKVFRHSFGEEGEIVAEIGHTIALEIDPQRAQQAGFTRITTCSFAHGPFKIKPTPTLSGPIRMEWKQGEIGGETLLLNPVASGLESGDQISLEVHLTTDGSDPCPPAEKEQTNTQTGTQTQPLTPSVADESDHAHIRTATIYVRLASFGLARYESESFVFVRSAQSTAWDARPGASVMYGLNLRDSDNWRKTWNFFSPSGGANVTLLDFDKNQTLEFGVGPGISFFQGQLIFGWGWNVSTEFSKKRYFFLGVSFTRIAGFIEKKIGKKPSD